MHQSIESPGGCGVMATSVGHDIIFSTTMLKVELHSKLTNSSGSSSGAGSLSSS